MIAMSIIPVSLFLITHLSSSKVIISKPEFFLMASTSDQQQCHLYSLADIQSATKNFDDGLVIGGGGFGKVYKGRINGSSTSVAIKRLDSMSDQGAPEFRAEIETLSKLRHAHLVSLLGCCDDGKEMILVYEYMPNGTLYHHLHNSDTPLSWMQRLLIGVGAARGLDYLHTGVGTRHGIIHRDVKSSNILLDEDTEAKISDFGLAKVCPINQPSTFVDTRIKGTHGYLDPEIAMTGKFTRKTDVFAFGVVLFELLSGRDAILPKGEEYLTLARWAQNCVEERNLDHVVAAEIRGTLSHKSLKEFAQVAYRCLHSDPKRRPTMSEVVVKLQLSVALQEKFEKYAKPVARDAIQFWTPGHADSFVSKARFQMEFIIGKIIALYVAKQLQDLYPTPNIEDDTDSMDRRPNPFSIDRRSNPFSMNVEGSLIYVKTSDDSDEDEEGTKGDGASHV